MRFLKYIYILSNLVEEIVFSYIAQYFILDNFWFNLNVNLCLTEHLGILFKFIHKYMCM